MGGTPAGRNLADGPSGPASAPHTVGGGDTLQAPVGTDGGSRRRPTGHPGRMTREGRK